MGNILRSDLPENPELLGLLERAKQPKPDAVGECPYCHHALEKQRVNKPFDTSTPMGPRFRPEQPLLTFWACTNELCSLMFWRQPSAKAETVADPAER